MARESKVVVVEVSANQDRQQFDIAISRQWSSGYTSIYCTATYNVSMDSVGRAQRAQLGMVPRAKWRRSMACENVDSHQ